MATLNDWMEGARVRTLPASLSPVILGAGIAAALKEFSWGFTLLAAGVALFFQIGANFANDYSDGIRGTDEFRQGPPRLTGGGKVEPKVVKRAAFISFGIACVLGFVLVALSGFWWLLLAGAAAVLAAWLYTGGKYPYGYMGLGEVFVLIFFGYMATIGTVYTQTGRAPLAAWLLATGVGLIACALLMVNNIRDIPSDTQAGKRTLAVLLGERKARWSYYAMLAVAVVLASSLVLWGYAVAVGFLGLLIWVVYLARPVIAGATGHNLLGVLRNTGLFELTYAVSVAAALVLGVFFSHWPWGIIGWVILGISWGTWILVEIALLAIRSSRTSHTPTSSTSTSSTSTQGDEDAATSDADSDAPEDDDASTTDDVTDNVAATDDNDNTDADDEDSTPKADEFAVTNSEADDSNSDNAAHGNSADANSEGNDVTTDESGSVTVGEDSSVTTSEAESDNFELGDAPESDEDTSRSAGSE